MYLLKRIVPVVLMLSLLIPDRTLSQDFSFQDGDRVCFVGNSITMSGSFHHYINLFYATRFPERKIKFFNCGISGEQAGHILRRVDTDILINNPTWCVVMAGSNDVNETLYSEANKHLPGLEEKKQEALTKYYENMTLLIEKLLAAKTKVILEVPCIYDQTGKLREENYFGANDALGKCREFLIKAAQKYGLLLVDYWSITKKINEALQRKDITATIISSDRSHPRNYGNFVMAYQFLHTQLHTSVVSAISIDRRNLQQINVSGAAADNVLETKNSVSFSSVGKALPFPAPDEIKLDSLVNFTQQLNSETIQVRGLEKGQYRLMIDSVFIARFTDRQLAKGIDISGYSNTPQYRQASNVLDLFNQYWKIETDLRSIKYVEYQHLQRLKNREDINVVKSFFDSALVKYKTSDNFNFFTKMFNKYLLLKPKESELQSALADKLMEIYEMNKPRRHIYSLERMNS